MRSTASLAAIAVTALALSFASPGLAQNTAPAPDCANPQTQLDMNICAGQTYKKADAALNAAYTQARAAMGSVKGRKMLREAERAWIAYRDKQCKLAAAPYEGGSIQPLIAADCLTRLTKAQTDELLNIAEPN